MNYLNVREIAEKWGVNVSLVRRYCTAGRIPDAVLRNGIWCIPEDAVRPTRTDFEHEYKEELPEFAKKLQNQKKKRDFHGLYDFVVIDLTYSSSRMASCRLTRQQVETIFRKGKVRESFEPMKVSDLIEVLNHIHCVNYILDHVMEPLTQKFIRKLHEILMTGTVDTYRQQVRPGEYRTVTSRSRDRELLPVSWINSSLTALIRDYEHQTEIERNQILDVHVRFEEIFPFEDGNGRVGRLIMFKECLKYNIVPFIIEDNLKLYYYRGLKEWNNEKGYLTDTCLTAQDKYKSYLDYYRIAYW